MRFIKLIVAIKSHRALEPPSLPTPHTFYTRELQFSRKPSAGNFLSHLPSSKPAAMLFCPHFRKEDTSPSQANFSFFLQDFIPFSTLFVSYISVFLSYGLNTRSAKLSVVSTIRDNNRTVQCQLSPAPVLSLQIPYSVRLHEADDPSGPWCCLSVASGCSEAQAQPG